MSNIDRAAQFSPFAALTGYGEAIEETARLTDEQAELSEDMKIMIDERLRMLSDRIGEGLQVTVSYFLPDKRKEGGKYVSVTGVLKSVDSLEGYIMLTDNTRIPITAVREIDGDIFGNIF